MIRRWVNKEIFEIAHRSQDVSPALFAEEGKIANQEILIGAVEEWKVKEQDVAKSAIALVLKWLTKDGILVESDSEDEFNECVDEYFREYKARRIK